MNEAMAQAIEEMEELRLENRALKLVVGKERAINKELLEALEKLGEPPEARTAIAKAKDKNMNEPASSIDYQQQRGVAWDIIEEALADYDNWMLDDDYNATQVLRRIMSRMRERWTKGEA